MTAAAPTDRPPRRRGALRWVLLALLLLPFLEVAVLVLVGRAIGFWWTFALVLVLAVAGVWLARRETGRSYRALQQALTSGRMPGTEVSDAILVMLGGFLLILPGFVSDVAGLLLVLPLTRPLARRLLHALVARQATVVLGASATGAAPVRGRRGAPGDVVEGEVVAETPPPGAAPRDAPPSIGP